MRIEDYYKELIDYYKKLIEKVSSSECPQLECHHCKMAIQFNVTREDSHLNCAACGSGLTRMKACCPECGKTILDSTFCGACGFNKPEWVKFMEFME